MTKYNYECNKCGRKFESEEGLNTHKEHCTKKKNGFFRKFIIVFAAIIAAIGTIGFLGLIFDSSNSIDPAYERASEEWDGYRQLLNNDIEELHEIGYKCIDIKNNEDLINCIGDGQARLNTYHSHLLQAKAFLEANSNLFSNSIELQEQIDDHITYVVATQYKMDIVINDYNAQQEAIRDLIKIAALNI